MTGAPVSSPTQRALTTVDVEGLVHASFGADVGVTEGAPLSGGGFAAVWRVRLDDGRQVVLKVAPPPGIGLLRYEAGMIPAEAEYLRLVGARAVDIPVARVLHCGSDPAVLDSDWLFTTFLPGTALPELNRSHADRDDTTVRRELGAVIARLHTVTGPEFGYSGPRAHAPTWAAAFAAIVEDLLADADSWGVPLPWPAPRIRKLVADNADVLDTVDRPALLHFDLWDGNVLASPAEDGKAHLTGLVDGERYLFGDPLMDFVSPAIYRRIEDEPGHPFLLGYAEAADRPLVLDGPARRRLALYRLHLYLLMTVEMPSRAMTPDGSPRRRAMLDGQLAELDRG